MSAQILPYDVKRARRAGARLAAVQALYQMEQSGQSGKAVVREFVEDRLGLGPEGEPIEDADPDLFKMIVATAVDRQEEIDAAIAKRLAKGWRMSRLDATTRAILRGGAAEILVNLDLADAIILDEYVSVAHAFFEGEEPRFVNGVLQNVARDLRAGEAGA